MTHVPSEGLSPQEEEIRNITPKLDGFITLERWTALPPQLKTELQRQEVIGVYATPDKQTSRQLHYEFTASGTDVESGQEIIVLIPDGEKMHLADILLGHRKREKFWGDTGNEYDSNGAYTEILVFDGNTNQWRSWKDPLGHDVIKYAERRASVEYEYLGTWHGMVGDLRPLAVKLISRGKGNPALNTVTIYSVDITTRPEVQDAEIMERIYTQGTAFADYTKAAPGPGAKPKFGGGKDSHSNIYGFAPQGGYPHAIPLRQPRGFEPFPLTKTVDTDTEQLDEQGRLHIKLPAGKKMLSLEVSAGCKWTNKPVGNPPQPIGVSGGHKLNAYLVTEQGKTDRFIDSANVGAEGVLSGGPTNPDYITQHGDEIILMCPAGTVYVMGFRMMFEDAGKEKTQRINALTAATHEAIASQAAPHLILDTATANKGTQGGRWYVDQQSGERYFVKTYEHHPQASDRCATEWIANEIYKKMGIPAVDSRLHEGKLMNREVKNLNHFSCPAGSKVAAAKEFYKNSRDVRNGFVVDAWLANWDVFGLDYDNVSLQRDENRMYRLDNGGTMFFRAQGQRKPSFASEEVQEIANMRNPAVAEQAGHIFQNITDQEIRQQVAKLVAVMADQVIENLVLQSGISKPQETIQALIKRRNWLAKNYPSKAPA